MQIQTTAIPDVLIIEPTVFGDDRGFFYENFNQKRFAELTKCLELGDHIPIRSLPYFKARRLLSTLLIPVTSPPAP